MLKISFLHPNGMQERVRCSYNQIVLLCSTQQERGWWPGEGLTKRVLAHQVGNDPLLLQVSLDLLETSSNNFQCILLRELALFLAVVLTNKAMPKFKSNIWSWLILFCFHGYFTEIWHFMFGSFLQKDIYVIRKAGLSQWLICIIVYWPYAILSPKKKRRKAEWTGHSEGTNLDHEKLSWDLWWEKTEANAKWWD